MNTFAAMMPAPRPADAVAPRGGADAVEVSPEGAAEAFGAVLGALKEGRSARDAARRDGKVTDDAAAEPANAVPGLVGPVDAGAIPPAAAMVQAALLALIARAAPGASAAPAGAAGQTASVPMGVADLAAGIALAAGESGRTPDGCAGLSVAGPAGPRTPGETRPQVTILHQETHFAPVKPGLVAGQAAAIPALTGLSGALAPLVPAPIPPAPAAVTETPRDATASSDAALGDAPAPVAAQTRAGVPPTMAGSPRAASPDPSGTPRRAAATPATPETAVASPTAQRIAGQAVPVEAAGPSPGEGPTAEAGASETIAPAAPAPGGTPPSAAPLGAPLGVPLGAPLGTPARQVAEAVAAELSRTAATATAAPGGEGPLRLLTLQLRPMDLGTVLVRMRLRDGQLAMSLHASREETAALLRQDGALLADLLRQSGYQPDSVTIGANAAGGAPQGDGGRQSSGAPFQPGGQGGGQAQTGAHPDQASRRPGDVPADDRSDPTSERTHETNASGPGRSGLYL